MVVYHEKTSHSTDAVDSLSWRHDFLLRKFFEAVPDVELKDDQRLFMHEQRLAIYRRDGGICKIAMKCKGDKCEWDNWQRITSSLGLRAERLLSKTARLAVSLATR